MQIHRLNAKSFRNLENLEINLCPNANIIYGANGQGKTNLLESLWMFTGARSFRGSKDSQLVAFGETKAAVEMDYSAQGREQTARMEIESRRKFIRNGVELRSAGEMAGQFCVVLFSPSQLALVRDGPGEKRRFLDVSIGQLRPKYESVLNQYQRALDQRNRVLKDLWQNAGLRGTLPVWESRLASLGAVITKTRASYVKRLLPYAAEIYGELSSNREIFHMEYASGGVYDESWDIPMLERQLLCLLENRREEDIRTRSSGFGAHRDDVRILLDGKSAREFGSQGQQRSCVLALKLAEGRLMEETLGEPPVVLLDDVMSELDGMRREYLLNHLGGRQLLLTCCDKAYFRALGQGRSFKIENGKLIQVRNYGK